MNFLHSIRRKRVNILKWIAFEWSSTLEIPHANHDRVWNLFGIYLMTIPKTAFFLNNNKLKFSWNFWISQIYWNNSWTNPNETLKLFQTSKEKKRKANTIVYIQIHVVFNITSFHLQLALITSWTTQIIIRIE